MEQDSAYDNPLISRYASRAMSALWGAQRKFSTWRRLWVALAEAESELGLPVTPQQIAELRAQLDSIDLRRAAEIEERVRHDVMAHVRLYGEQCPKARPIIHWGATSAYVTDNTDLILMREGLGMLRDSLVRVIDAWAEFAVRHRALPCLGLTHMQPAQLTTVGKRATLWCYDLVLDLAEVEHRLGALRFRGVKGTTGTQASFLAMFGGDHARVERLDRLIAEKMGFSASYTVTGQTYTRKVDSQVLDVLSGISQSAHKFGTDLRLLASRKEMEEPFEPEQIGSSAMAYKRNPMRAERLCGLSRFTMGLASVAATTCATQWFERTLDDSANRRLTLPQAFLATDAALRLYLNIVQGIVLYPEVMRRYVAEELPFIASENVLMAAVAAGGDRQDLHERIRRHSMAAAAEVKEHGRPNDLLARLKQDPAFRSIDLDTVLDPEKFVGRAPEQVDHFIAAEIAAIRARYPGVRPERSEVKV